MSQNVKTELLNIALEGTHSHEVMDGFCEPEKAFRRFYLERGKYGLHSKKT